MAEDARAPYEGPIRLGMVFDWEKGKKHLYERLTVMKMAEGQIWAWGRSGETYYDEADFRRAAVFVSPTPILKPRPNPPAGPVARYGGPIEIGMAFDFEPGKKHLYERLTISRKEGIHLWARGRSGETYFEEPDFRNRVVPVAPAAP